MKFFSTLFCAFFFLQLNAQGWDRTLTDSMKITSLSPTSDGGCIMSGNVVGLSKTAIVKVNAQGKREWRREFSDIPIFEEPFTTGHIKILQDSDGNYWWGVPNSSTENNVTTIVKFDKNGKTLFQKTIRMAGTQIHTLNNLLVLFGIETVSFKTALLRLKSNGDTLDSNLLPSIRFSRSPYFTSAVQGNGVLVVSNADTMFRNESIKIGFDGIIKLRTTLPTVQLFTPFPLTQMIKTFDGSYLVPDSAFVIKIDSVGRFLWRKSLSVNNPIDFSPYFRYLMAATTPDGGFMAIQQNADKKYLDIRRFSPAGVLINSNFLFYQQNLDLPHLIRVSNSGFIVAGNTLSNLEGTQVHLLRLDDNGYFYSNFIKGNIFSDRDVNCKLTGNDIPIQRVIVTAKRTGFPDILALTDTLGKYNLNVDVGTYTVGIVNPNKYMVPCIPSVIKTISTINPLDSVDFALTSNFSCGLMQVDIATPRLRRCFNNNYTISYCNKGTAMATGAYVNITLDSLLEFISAEKPVATKTGRVYRFNLGDVAINDCKTFDIVARVRCGDSTRLGQTMCVDAKIFPDTICGADLSFWSGASLAVSGSCQGDSVVFQVQNLGRAASTATLSVVAENLGTTAVNIAPLAVNGIFTKKYPSNGNTWRMIVNQVPNHPRSFQPTAFVEGCRKNPATPFVTGFAAGFANDDADLSVDTDCQPLIGSFDPNDKIGYPLGTGTTKAIAQNQDIEYMIRFQNTGTDTAFTVVIRDTIDANLDLLSIEWGASSHKYKPEIYDKNIVKFTFDNILLVDSFTNEPKSNGYIKYRIKQKKDVAFGTRIQNSAGIYFDFNDPVLTNKTLHTVSKNIVSAIVEKSKTTYEMVKVYPNPATETLYFELKDGFSSDNKTNFELFDMMGKRVKTAQFSGARYEFHRETLPSGVYLFKMMRGNAILGAGKLIIQ
jgi:uncharacterized repeat protein (TIGR01451 family)